LAPNPSLLSFHFHRREGFNNTYSYGAAGIFFPALSAMVLGICVLGGVILLGLSKTADPYYGQNFESIKQQETGGKK